jgi:hypothetical protein
MVELRPTVQAEVKPTTPEPRPTPEERAIQVKRDVYQTQRLNQ